MRTTFNRLRVLAPLAAGALLLSPLVTGCAGDEATATSPNSTVGLQLSAGAGPPTLAELTSRLELGDPQVAAIEPPLADWQSNHAAGQRTRRGFRNEGGDFQEPPMMAFLEKSAATLDEDQFMELLAMLGERQAAHRAEMEARMESMAERFGNGERPGGRRGGPGGRGSENGGPFADLDLTDTQKAAIKDAFRGEREATRSLREGFRDGTVSAEAFKSGLKEQRSVVQETVAGIVGEEAYAALEARKTEQVVKRAERQLERVGEHNARRLEFLTTVLALTPDQVTQAQGVMESAATQVQAILGGVIDGTADPIDALVDGLVARRSAKDALAAILDADQTERFEALQNLLPGPGSRGRHHRG